MNDDYREGMTRAQVIASSIVTNYDGNGDDGIQRLYRIGFIDGCAAVFAAITAELQNLDKGNIDHERDRENAS